MNTNNNKLLMFIEHLLRARHNVKCFIYFDTLILPVLVCCCGHAWKFMILFHLLTPSAAAAESLQSYPTLCDPRDGSPPGCPVPGILQARTLEWVAISFSDA